MPTYDYRCKACGHAFEEFQSMSAKLLRKCPKCGKAELERLIGTGAAIVFKGSGFYQTDYRSEGYKKSADADKPASETKPDDKSAKTQTKAETKTDTKAEAKAESKPRPVVEAKPTPEPAKPAKGKKK